MGKGNVVLEAVDTSAIDARSKISAISSSGNMVPDGSATSFGSSLAFNTIGWDIDSLSYDALDTLLGNSISTETPADVQAYISDSTVAAIGDVTLTATSDTQLNATVSNTADSTASSTFGSQSMSGSGVLASNRISRSTQAYINDSDPSAGRTVDVQGRVDIDAER